MTITIQPIAYVKNPREGLSDDNWGGLVSEIYLANHLPSDAFDGIADFSHLQIIFHFHLANANKIVTGSEYPRENLAWPKVGIFAQRKKSRPNLLGTTMVQLVKHEARSIFVQGLDAINGTPIIDIKPVFKEFLPHQPIKQAAWSVELMQHYFDE